MTKLVAGIGVYEKGHYPGKVAGIPTKEYTLWTGLLGRCEPDGLVQVRCPTYIGCSVHRDFIKFQDFAGWCHTQIGFRNKGWALDKDILVQGNKVYGPDTCCFVPKSINSMLTHKQSNQGIYPTGVSFDITRNLYQSKIKIEGRTKNLGRFETPEAAEFAYKIAKLEEIRRLANLWKPKIGHKVYFALLKYQI